MITSELESEINKYNNTILPRLTKQALVRVSKALTNFPVETPTEFMFKDEQDAFISGVKVLQLKVLMLKHAEIEELNNKGDENE